MTVRNEAGKTGKTTADPPAGRTTEHETHLEDAVTRSIKSVTLSLVAALGVWGAAPARSADITVYLNQATESGVRQLAAGFEKATGYKVEVSFQGGANLNQKIVSDAPGDL